MSSILPEKITEFLSLPVTPLTYGKRVAAFELNEEDLVKDYCDDCLKFGHIISWTEYEDKIICYIK